MLPLLQGASNVWGTVEPPTGAQHAARAAGYDRGGAGAAETQQLARRFARALTLRGHSRDWSDPSRKRAARTKNCASSRRDERQRRRQLVRLALAAPSRASEAIPASLGEGGDLGEEEAQLLGAIRNLQADIAALERSTLLRDSSVVCWRTNRAGAALDLMNEYFVQLAGGYDPCNPLRVESSACGRRFIERFLAPDVVCRDFQGVQAFMDQWEKYTSFHDDFFVQMTGLRVLRDSERLVSIFATAEFLLTFNANTVKYLYPALDAEAQQDERTRALTDRLIGGRLRLPLDIVMHFNESGRVFAFESRSHLTTALLEVLQDPADAMHVNRLALMTSDGHWKIGPDDDAYHRQQRVPQMLM